MKSSLFGFAVIAGCVSILALLVPDEQVGRPMWIFIFLVLSACSIFSWSHPNAPKNPSGWLRLIALAVALGAVLAGVDALLHGLSSISIVLDLFSAVCGGIVAFADYVRCLALKGVNNV